MDVFRKIVTSIKEETRRKNNKETKQVEASVSESGFTYADVLAATDHSGQENNVQGNQDWVLDSGVLVSYDSIKGMVPNLQGMGWRPSVYGKQQRV